MKKFKIPQIVNFIFILIGLLGFLLPYATSTTKQKQFLLSNPDVIAISELNMKYRDMIDLSMLKYFRVDLYVVNNPEKIIFARTDVMVDLVLLSILAVSILFIVLFTLLNKPIGNIVFAFIMLGASLIMNYDMVSRGVIPSESYTYGITYYLYVILAIAIIICSIANIVVNKIDKKKVINRY